MSSADVVFYHAPTHNPGSSLRYQGNKALIAMISMEQPKYSPVLANLKYLSSNVDLMVTYSLADTYPGTGVANMPITYWPLNIVSPQAVLQPPRPFKDKTGYDTGMLWHRLRWAYFEAIPVFLAVLALFNLMTNLLTLYHRRRDGGCICF